jgi:hypothetical protein
MLQGLGNLLGTNSTSPLTQTGLGGGLNPLALGQAGLGNQGLGGALGTLGTLGALSNLGGLGGQPKQSNLLSGLLSSGIKSSQNDQRLMQEKQQRNLLRKYLTQQSGDPIQSSLISSMIPGKGALDDFDVGLGTRSSILSKLGGLGGNQSNLLGLGGNQSGLLGSLAGNQNNSVLGNLGTMGTLASLAGGNQNAGLLNSLASNNNNSGLLSSLVSLAGTPNNNGNIFNSLGGLGSGLLGGGNPSSGGLLGSIQNGVNTLNTINKVNNAVSGIKALF